MDLSNRPRHTHRSLARLSQRAAADSGAGSKQLLDASSLKQRYQPGIREGAPPAEPAPQAVAGSLPVGSRQGRPAVDESGYANPAALLVEFVRQIEAASHFKPGSQAKPEPLPAGQMSGVSPLGASVTRPASERLSDRSPLLALLADEIEVQAAAAGGEPGRWQQALDRSVKRLFAQVSARQPSPQGAPASTPEELIAAFAQAIGAINSNLSGSTLQGSGLATGQASAPETRARPRQAPRLELMPDGQRCEYFDCGAAVVKDVLGRVTEVKSASGEKLLLQHDSSGNLDSFVRLDSLGRTHSEGRRDKHGVVVRDPQGRVRAAGESMTVDPRGCLWINNLDGQFVSLDLVREVHLERRRVANAEGRWHTLTAVFAQDGFRMVTWFHDCDGHPGRGASPADKAAGSLFRFYGRDGSLVEFASEEDLRHLRPARVLCPGSYPVAAMWRGQRQAYTAWEAVKEYLDMIS